MKHLKRTLLIHWLHYKKELVEMDNINFFTGNNGAGKSAYLDALQVVLLGEANNKNFNKAANDRSERTLDGYLRADRDKNSKSSRHNKDFCSYIVCEFYDDLKENHFVVGILFECYKNGDKKHRFFGYDGEIPSHCFIQQDIAMNMEQLKKFVHSKEHSNLCWTDTPSQYRSHFTTRTNLFDAKFFSLLKKSIALKEVRRIEDFITENVCDMPEPPDIYAMQENIRNYKDQERLAQREREKFHDLEEICNVFSQLEGMKNVLAQQEFLVLWGEQELLREELTAFQTQEQRLSRESQDLELWLQEKNHEKEQKNQKYDELKYKRDHDDAVKEQKRLENLLQHLKNEENDLNHGIQKELSALQKDAHDLTALCTRIMKNSPMFPNLHPLSENVIHAYAPFLNAEPSIFGQGTEIFSVAKLQSQELSQELSPIVHETELKLTQLREEIHEKEENIIKLKQNIKSYPRGLVELRDYLLKSLHSPEHPCEVEILADTLEIVPGEEGWRGTIEAYLNTQKFYLILSPSHYSQALILFQQWKEKFREKDSSFGLVDLKKLQENSNLSDKNQSLSRKLLTTNPLSEDYIRYLLGDVLCCETPEEARQYRKAVTMDGLVYQGYVMRNFPKRLMESAFIGKKAIELQLKQMEQEREILHREQQYLETNFAPFRDVKTQDWLLNSRYLTHDLLIVEKNYLHSLENRKQQAQTQESLSKCDLFWLKDLEEQIQNLKLEINKLERSLQEAWQKQGQLSGQIKYTQEHQIPEKSCALEEKQLEISRNISPEFRDEVGLPRFAQELARLGKVQTIVQNFSRESQGQKTRKQKQTDELFRLRQSYLTKNTGSLFSTDPEQNEDYEKEKRFLEESKLPAYAEKIKEARESAIEQFQNEFIDKLKSNIEQVKRQIKDLNKALKGNQFGSESYEFLVEKNPSYSRFYEMIMSDLRMGGDVGLFRMEFERQFEAEREELFMQLAEAEDNHLGGKSSELEKNIKLFTDFRTYLTFDMETTDKQGTKQRLSKILATNSGGETQTPFYVAMLASYAQLYKVNDLGSSGNTIRLVIFDEAFSKMDGDRIIECVKLLRTLNLQAIMCTPPEKVADIMPEVDQTLIFRHENHQMTTNSFRNQEKKKL